MHEFIAKHQDKIAGTLSGFDRLVFRGHLRSIGTPQGMMSYRWTNQVLLKNFGDHGRRLPRGSRKLPWLRPRLADAR
jgi:hypothetical protein